MSLLFYLLYLKLKASRPKSLLNKSMLVNTSATGDNNGFASSSSSKGSELC